MRQSYDGRSAVDLLRDDDEEKAKLPLPALIVGGVLAIALLGFGYSALTSNSNSAAAFDEGAVIDATPGTPVATNSSENQVLSNRTQPPTRVNVPAPAPSILPPPGATVIDPDDTKWAPVFHRLIKEGGPVAIISNRTEDVNPQVQLHDASFKQVYDNNGYRLVGRVKIKNETDSRVTDFRLEVEIGEKAYMLVPFEGTIKKAKPLASRVIEPKQMVEWPVIIYAMKFKNKVLVDTVRMQAWLDSPPSMVTDVINN